MPVDAPFLIVPNALIITCTIFVLIFHILLTSIYRSLYLLSFSVSFVLKFESSGMAISRQFFSFYHAVPYQVGLLVCPICDNRYVTHDGGIARAERDGTRAETRIRLFPKRTSPFKSVGASVQWTAGSRGVRIGFSNDGYTTLGGGLRVLATHSIR